MLGRALAALGVVLAALHSGAAEAPKPTFSVDYLVRISKQTPDRAKVRWELAGIDEIDSLRLVFRDERTHGVRGTGQLDWHERTLTWRPGQPYAHLEYEVQIDRHRPPGGPRYDSYAGDGWIVTRALALFPAIHIDWKPDVGHPTSRARLLFRLPAGWRSVTTGERLGDNVFEVAQANAQFDRPRGWLALGDIRLTERRIGGTIVTLATVPGTELDVAAVFRTWEQTLPLLAGVLGPPPPRLLVVSAPDPMWRGGISGERSFFVHAATPFRSRDATSTWLHELFHTWQPFRPKHDGRWIAEGLAEYYTLVLQRRAGMLPAAGFARGVRSFVHNGRWEIDLSRTRASDALNNSAPAVMYALDREIARATNGRRSLDDAVRQLAETGGALTTATFLRAVTRTADKDLTPLFRRHVFRGLPPALEDQPALPPRAGLGYTPPGAAAAAPRADRD
ncbi:MAG: hypothetical protein KIT14_24355 [bacterium]|nr:hypothetical protein [bacterium]